MPVNNLGDLRRLVFRRYRPVLATVYQFLWFPPKTFKAPKFPRKHGLWEVYWGLGLSEGTEGTKATEGVRWCGLGLAFVQEALDRMVSRIRGSEFPRRLACTG